MWSLNNNNTIKNILLQLYISQCPLSEISAVYKVDTCHDFDNHLFFKVPNNLMYILLSGLMTGNAVICGKHNYTTIV